MLIYLQMIESEADRNKFVAMYEAHKQWMHGIAMQYLHNHHDAEDAVHQAFLYVAKNMDKISEAICPKTRGYLAIIIKHMAIDMIRQRKNIDFDPVSASYEETFHDDDSLTTAILQLPERDREALLLRFRHGYTVKELANYYGLKYDAMQKRLLRAKQALEKVLDENGVVI